ncbi:hypothetical protein Btru_075516 [Bulinus truncatus]|nr:hypothetical protein Btru_075516 [Bulinus truncatus]
MLSYRVIILVALIVFVAISVVNAQAECDLICPRIYAPVCASNGQTYASECVMNGISCTNNLGLTVAHDGPC